MKIGDTIVVTPQEDPAGYTLDWRRRLAVASTATRLPAQYAKDPDLRAYLTHLRQRVRYPLELDAKPNTIDRIDGWQGNETGGLLAAYLLTTAPYTVIAQELGLDAGEIRLYGSIHWSVRDDDHPISGVLIRLRAALPREPGDDDRLIRAALLGGLEGLRGQTGARAHSDLSVMVEQELSRRVVAGEMKTGDLIRLRSHDLMLKKIELDSREGQQQDQDATRLLLDLLNQTAPRMKPIDQTPEQIQAADTLLRARIDSQRLATGIGVVEAGGERRLDSMLKKMQTA